MDPGGARARATGRGARDRFSAAGHQGPTRRSWPRCTPRRRRPPPPHTSAGAARVSQPERLDPEAATSSPASLSSVGIRISAFSSAARATWTRASTTAWLSVLSGTSTSSSPGERQERPERRHRPRPAEPRPPPRRARPLRTTDLRLDTRGSFQRTINEGYYGIGNAVSAGARPRADTSGGRLNQYMQEEGRVRVISRVHTGTPVRPAFGANLRYEAPESLRAGSKLAADSLARETRTAQPLPCVGAQDEALAGVAAGVMIDTRDSEFVTTSGIFYQQVGGGATVGLRARESPTGEVPPPSSRTMRASAAPSSSRAA